MKKTNKGNTKFSYNYDKKYIFKVYSKSMWNYANTKFDCEFINI